MRNALLAEVYRSRVRFLISSSISSVIGKWSCKYRIQNEFETKFMFLVCNRSEVSEETTRHYWSWTRYFFFNELYLLARLINDCNYWKSTLINELDIPWNNTKTLSITNKLYLLATYGWVQTCQYHSLMSWFYILYVLFM